MDGSKMDALYIYNYHYNSGLRKESYNIGIRENSVEVVIIIKWKLNNNLSNFLKRLSLFMWDINLNIRRRMFVKEKAEQNEACAL